MTRIGSQRHKKKLVYINQLNYIMSHVSIRDALGTHAATVLKSTRHKRVLATSLVRQVRSKYDIS